MPITDNDIDCNTLAGTGNVYLMHSNSAFLKLPDITLSVGGKEIVFLADTGATHSINRFSEFPDVKNSGRMVHSVGASSVPQPKIFSTPLRVNNTQAEMSLKHSFLISKVCPINLLGRDPPLSLTISLVPTPDGMTVMYTPPAQSMTSFDCPPCSAFVYQWVWPECTSSSLLNSAMTHITPDAILMPHQALYCTALYTPDCDPDFESDFFSVLTDSIQINYFFWWYHASAFSVQLTAVQLPFYQVSDATPHISVPKGDQDEWEDLAPFVKSWTSFIDAFPATSGRNGSKNKI